MATTETRDPSVGAEPEQQSALKPLIYILVVPSILIAILQWTDLPSMIVKAVTGH